MIKKLFIFFFIFSIFLNLSGGVVFAAQQAQNQGKGILWGLPDQIKNLFLDLKNKAESIWSDWIFPEIKNIWDNIVYFFQNNLGVSKPAIQQKFDQEKQNLKQEAPTVGKSLWQKFQDLIK